MKPTPESRDYDFRAVYITHNQVGTTDYRSLPLAEAKAYDTVGLYDLDKEGEGLEEKHVADMSVEDFALVVDSPYPKGFSSWQQSHFEVVQALGLEQQKKASEKSAFMAKLELVLGRSALYGMAAQMTDLFEKSRGEIDSEEALQEEVRAFVASELKALDSGK